MSRETQYIGLNSYALNFVKDAIRVEEYDMTHGMFGEIIKGKIYHMPIENPDVNSESIFIEVVQCAPWSSGPMIFTYLKWSIVKKCDNSVVEMEKCFKWMFDPSLKNGIEADFATGRYYV